MLAAGAVVGLIVSAGDAGELAVGDANPVGVETEAPEAAEAGGGGAVHAVGGTGFALVVVEDEALPAGGALGDVEGVAGGAGKRALLAVGAVGGESVAVHALAAVVEEAAGFASATAEGAVIAHGIDIVGGQAFRAAHEVAADTGQYALITAPRHYVEVHPRHAAQAP